MPEHQEKCSNRYGGGSRDEGSRVDESADVPVRLCTHDPVCAKIR